MMDKALYDGWELKYFDKAFNFRNYQFELVKKFITGKVAEVGPGNGAFLKYFCHGLNSNMKNQLIWLNEIRF